MVASLWCEMLDIRPNQGRNILAHHRDVHYRVSCSQSWWPCSSWTRWQNSQWKLKPGNPGNPVSFLPYISRIANATAAEKPLQTLVRHLEIEAAMFISIHCSATWWWCSPTMHCPSYSRTGKVRLTAKNIGFRMELLGTPKVRLGVPA